jgi:putative transposase
MFASPENPPQKHHPIHQPLVHVGNRSQIVFLTVCVAHRRPILANPEMHGRMLNAWKKAGHWLVGRYVLMPDHLHLFCSPATLPAGSLSGWVAYWKRLVAFEAKGSIWQKNFWDTQLRGHESYAAKWEYVHANPVRAGLVKTPDDWPFQGTVNELRWHA